jgi:hypothetical protein
MSKDRASLEAAEARLIELRERMIQSIGVHTVNVLIDRAIWEASRKHPALALIEHDEAGLSFDALNARYGNQDTSDLVAGFEDLTAELLMILTRLLGRDIAHRLAQEIELRMPRTRTALTKEPPAG